MVLFEYNAVAAICYVYYVNDGGDYACTCDRWSRIYRSHTCVELLNAGYDIVVVDNFSNSKPEVLNV